MREISIDDLPAHSPWPARVLGLESWNPDESHGGTAVARYDEQFGHLLAHRRENPDIDFRGVKAAAIHYGRESPVPVSRDGTVYLADIDEVQSMKDEALVSAFEDVLDGGETVVSLGCGWGYNLGVLAEEYPDCTFVGGEVAPNGVELGQALFGDYDRVHVERFDFSEDRWDLLAENSGSETVLFTRGALTTLPNVAEVVEETLVRHLDGVACGVHLEPLAELHSSETVLGLLRRGYTELRGYNSNVLTTFREAGRIEITATSYDVVGANPFFPTSELHWKPA